MLIFEWFNNQVLKMEWLNHWINLLVEKAFGLNTEERLGASIQFFLYDVLKIFLLLSVMIFITAYIQSFFPPERSKKILGRFNGLSGNILAALLGTVTAFCSCSSIPLFIGFTSSGLPLGTSFSFLISSPLVDLASVLLLASIFNWKIAIAYVFVGVVLAVVGGLIIGKLKMEKFVESFVISNDMLVLENKKITHKARLHSAKKQVMKIINKVWLYVLIGVGIGAAIHNYIPQSFINALIGADKWWSVLIATLVGVPMYADIFSTLPIAEALVASGVGLGTVLSFMMGVTALSLPSIVMLSKVVKTRLLGIFLAIVISGIILIGYSFNAFSYLFI